MEEKAQHAMEMTKEEDDETKEDQKSIPQLVREHGVVKHPSGLQLGFD